jgi:hypothetical protein
MIFLIKETLVATRKWLSPKGGERGKKFTRKLLEEGTWKV